MKKVIITLTLVVFLIGCDVNTKTTFAADNTDTMWAWLQINVDEEGDAIESYYYYARIPKNTYEAITNNEISEGFILLQSVMYWGDDDLVHEYRDAESSGDIVFRIEDIKRIAPVVKKPIAGRGYEQFEETEKPEPNAPAQGQSLKSQ